MPLITQSQTRKEQRKQNRKRRKHSHPSRDEWVSEPVDSESEPKKTKKPASQKKNRIEKVHRFEDSDFAAAVRRDEEEIAALEAKLGIRKSKKSKEKLNKEYAKLEGYGDDFGDFLDDLDDLTERISSSRAAEDHDDSFSKHEESIDPDVAAAMRRDDEEIAALEQKLGLGKKKEKSKLHKEYKVEGYGDDFGDFLDDLDEMVARVRDTTNTKKYTGKLMEPRDENDSFGASSESEDSADEEIIPMKDASYDEIDEDDSVLEELEQEEDEIQDSTEESEIDESNSNDANDEIEEKLDTSESSEQSDDDDESNDDEPDHDLSDTYRPKSGEDIYGKRIDGDDDHDAKSSKYVPPHLRKKEKNDTNVEEKVRAIRRALNNALNRLSEDTLVSVAQQVAQVYKLHPTQMVHEVLWKNTKDACVLTPMLATGLVPVYLACIVGAHIQTGDTVQVGEYILEAVVIELWRELKSFRESKQSDAENDIPREVASKHICNRVLLLCYLYNYDIVHCSFLYDVVRHLIEEFTEVDIECLLIFLSHCGRSLRSDDPLALKEIVLLVQKKQAEGSRQVSSSRAEYMVDAISDLKNNKRRKQDSVYGEKTTKMKKLIGRIKSVAAKSNTAKTVSESSLRITLKDILDAQTKGRWWKVGASWVGNQYRYSDGATEQDDDDANKPISSADAATDTKDDKLLRLASKLRMNTDRKRSIFCIIMGSEDCEDAFEKLCRGSMLQNRSERDACRVLLECCATEKSYNKFYGHLATRMSEFQPQCKFSLQLAFWDLFKQFDSMEARRAANLAKLLFHLVVTHQLLRLMTVLKGMDISEGDMDNSAMIFLTIVLSSVLDHYEDTGSVKAMFASRHSEQEPTAAQEQEEGARASLLVFLMETLKASPKNKKGSRFRKNLKAAVKALDTDGFEDMF